MARSTVEHLRRARDLMDRHYAQPLDLDALAREAGFSRYHFARAFRQAYGETPGAYLSRRRVERAKDLLRSVNLTVSEICLLVGFSSLGSFSARFRELVGSSPTEYRRRHVERAGSPPVPGCFLMAWSRPGASGAGPSPAPPLGTALPLTGEPRRRRPAIGEKPAAPASP